MPANLSTSIDITASPERVWSIVSDLRRMGEWSPSTRRVIVRGGKVQQGATTINLNRAGWKVWPTQSKVVAFEPNKRIAFKVRENHSVWSFDLEELPDGGTKVVQQRDVSGDTTRLSKVLIDRLMGGEPTFEANLLTGMKQTLVRIKAAAEQA